MATIIYGYEWRGRPWCYLLRDVWTEVVVIRINGSKDTFQETVTGELRVLWVIRRSVYHVLIMHTPGQV